jgi:hypothetical protein
VLTILHYVFDINISMSSDAVVQLMSLLRNVPIFAVKTVISNVLFFTFTPGSSGNCDRKEVDLNVDFLSLI